MFSWMVIHTAERRPTMAARANITTESQRAQEMRGNANESTTGKAIADSYLSQ